MAKTRPLSGGAPSQRQLRVGEVIRRALSEILARGEVHDPELAHVSVTVAEVRVSPDLRHATAFVLPLGGRQHRRGGARRSAATAPRSAAWSPTGST